MTNGLTRPAVFLGAIRLLEADTALLDLINRNATEHNGKVLPFTEFYAIFHPLGREAKKVYDKNVSTWQEIVISKNFHLTENDLGKIPQDIISKAESFVKLVLAETSNPELESPKNKSAYHFWLYLNWLYSLLVDAPESRYRDDNIFGFMKGFPVFETKAVILALDPSPYVASSGYAFHNSKCRSTEAVLDFLNDEMMLFQTWSTFQLPEKSWWENIKAGCDLGGWIAQKVLLLNIHLTYNRKGSHPHLGNAWTVFTNFIINYLCAKDLPFVVCGEEARNIVKEQDNFIIRVLHPNSANHQRDGQAHNDGHSLNWGRQLPFLNINFYLHQKRQPMIDWLSVAGEITETNEARLESFRKFFEEILHPTGLSLLNLSQSATTKFVCPRQNLKLMPKRRTDNCDSYFLRYFKAGIKRHAKWAGETLSIYGQLTTNLESKQ